MLLHNLQEAEAALVPFIPSAAHITGRDITLTRMWPMMKILGNPEKKLKIVHLAGTSGKTSTAYYMAALLQATGKKIGLHVSPHIDTVTERFQINGQPISDDLFCQELGIFLDIINEHAQHPTYFELHIAFAYWFFDRQAVDYAVIETGMGGLHDGTNVAQNEDKICVITDIGIDHTKYLGTTIEQISHQKAGIIHPHNTVYMYEQGPTVMSVMRDTCQAQDAHLVTTTEDQQRQQAGQLLQSDLALFQQRNWLLAYFVFQHIQQQDQLPLPDSSVLIRTQMLQVPGRMDIKKVGDKTVIMDGAHNEQKMLAFVKSFQARYPGKKAVILLSLKQDKDYRAIVDILLPIAAEIITTSFVTSQELPVVSMEAETLAAYCTAQGFAKVLILPNHHEAYTAMLRSKEPIAVITGSFYLLYQIREEEQLL